MREQTEDYRNVDRKEEEVDLIESRFEARVLGCHVCCDLSELSSIIRGVVRTDVWQCCTDGKGRNTCKKSLL